MNPAKTKVKGTPVYRMKVVPHRPLKNALLTLIGFALIGVLVAATYFYAQHQASSERLSPQEAQELRAHLDRLNQEVDVLKRELAKYQMSAQVDHQAGEDLRKRVMELRDEKAALQRDVEVYRILSSNKSANPMGISFGVFSVVPLVEGKQQFKLVVQKLVEGGDDFIGQLQVSVVGKKEGADVKMSLHELVVTQAGSEPMAVSIPLNFKFFQSIDAEIVLPDGFTPERVELAVKSDAKRNPVTIKADLEWPDI